MRIIDIRIEVEDDLFEEAWNVALAAASSVKEDMYEVDELSVEVFDASADEASDPTPHNEAALRTAADDGLVDGEYPESFRKNWDRCHSPSA